MKKNVAVLGYGGQGAWHCGQILKSDAVQLLGVYDIRETRNEAARAAGIAVYPSAEALLADPAVEIAVIATPNDVHLPLVVQALESGKHVICEKPAALSVADFDAMTEAAARAGRLLTVHQNRRWDVDFLAVRQVIGSGEIGEVLRIESRIHGSRGIPSDWRCTKAAGGGMILDWGVHLIDQMLQLIPETVTRVDCTTTHITNQEVDDGFRLELAFASGKTAHVEIGMIGFQQSLCGIKTILLFFQKGISLLCCSGDLLLNFIHAVFQIRRSFLRRSGVFVRKEDTLKLQRGKDSVNAVGSGFRHKVDQ